MIIYSTDPLIRLTGRWDICDNGAVSTANGSYFEFSFTGETAVLEFDISDCTIPYPRLYIAVDRGARIEVPIDRFLRISADSGTHYVQVIMKCSAERQSRWTAPIASKVCLCTVEADAFSPLSPDERDIIVFIGDSITEGISIDNDLRYTHYGNVAADMVYWGDSTAGYAYLTAKELDMRPFIMGYGCLGATKPAAGGVPKAPDSYAFYSNARPIDAPNAKIVVINLGTNDSAADSIELRTQYMRLLETVRQLHPDSCVAAMIPFCGERGEEISDIVDAFNFAHGSSVRIVNTSGWIPADRIHPSRESNKTAARLLSEFLREEFNL